MPDRGGSWGFRRREADAEEGAFAGGGFEVDVAAMGADQGVRDGQAQARAAAGGGAGAGGVDAVEAFEDAGGLLGGQAGALVGDFEDAVTVPGSDADTDGGAGRGV